MPTDQLTFSNAQPVSPAPASSSSAPGGLTFNNVQPVDSSSGLTFSNVQPAQLSTWGKIKNIWHDATSTPIPEVIGRAFGPKGEAAAKIGEMGSPEFIGSRITRVGANELAQSKNRIVSRVGKVAGGINTAEEGALRSAESPVGAVATLAGAEPVQEALPIAANISKGLNLAFGGQGAINLIMPKAKDETTSQYLSRVGSGAAQTAVAVLAHAPLLKSAAPTGIVTDTDAAKMALENAATISPAKEIFIGGDGEETAATAKVVSSDYVPVASKTDLLAKHVQNIINNSQELKAAGVDAENIQTPGDVTRALDAAAAHVSQNLDSRVGATISLAEQRNLASDLGMSLDQLMSRRSGQAFNAEQAIAARSLLKDSVTDLLNNARLANLGDEDYLAQFRTSIARHMEIQNQVAGVRAEAGRALGSFRADTVESKLGDALAGLNPTSLAKAAQLLSKTDLSDTAAVNKIIREITPSSTPEKIFEIYRNALLSSPKTAILKGVSE